MIQKFDYKYRSEIRLRLEFQKTPCDLSRINWRQYPWVNILVMMFSLVSLFLHAKYLVSIQRRYEKLRNYYNQEG